MRLFIAVTLPEAQKDHIAALKADIGGAAWVRREGYHLTLRFLGDGIPETRLPALQTALREIQQPPFELILQGVGRFPPNRKPARVLWVGAAPSLALNQLYQAVEHAVTQAGFPPDDHAFSGHITLARLKANQPDPHVDDFLRRHATFAAEPFPVAAFHLFSSELTPQGARYMVVAAYPLRG